MARPERFELPTYSSGGCRSIQLSYARVPLVYIGTRDLLFTGLTEELKSRELSAESQPPRTENRLSPSTIATITAAASAARPLGFGTGLIHIDGAASDLRPVQSSDSFLAFFSICHFHKREST